MTVSEEYQVTRTFLFESDPVSFHDFLAARRMFRREVKELALNKLLIIADRELDRMALNLMRRTRAADPMAYAKMIREMREH